MKEIFLFLASLSGLASAYQPQTIAPGTVAPDFSLQGTDEKTYTLADFSGKKALAVIFTTNHCPDAIASHGRMVKLVDDFKNEDVAFVAIKLIAKDSGFNLPYLYDGETQAVAKAYGAVATPHVFVFNKELKLAYQGRMDNGKRRLGPVEKNEARDAIAALLKGEKPRVEKTRPIGCSMKWKEKAGMVAEENRKWRELPVSVELAKTASLKSMMANQGEKAKGMRLINLWSTSCGPCIKEFPDLAKIARQFSWQDFEFVSVSFDQPDDLDKVKKFLRKQEVGKSKNVIFEGDSEELTTVFPKWNGSLPYTVLIGPEGEVLYRHHGLIDPLELKKKIVAQVWKK